MAICASRVKRVHLVSTPTGCLHVLDSEFIFLKSQLSHYTFRSWKFLSRVQLFVSPWTVQSMDFSGQNIGVGSRSLLQENFKTRGSNPGLPHCRQVLYQLSHKGSPRTLEGVAYPFSRGSSLTQESNRGLPHCRKDSLATELPVKLNKRVCKTV